MNINLRKVLETVPDCLQSRKKLKSVLRDMYPDAVREINIILDTFETGIPVSIYKSQGIDNTQYQNSINKIVNDYGLQEIYAKEALDAWIYSLLGEDYIIEKNSSGTLPGRNEIVLNGRFVSFDAALPGFDIEFVPKNEKEGIAYISREIWTDYRSRARGKEEYVYSIEDEIIKVGNYLTLHKIDNILFGAGKSDGLAFPENEKFSFDYKDINGIYVIKFFENGTALVSINGGNSIEGKYIRIGDILRLDYADSITNEVESHLHIIYENSISTGFCLIDIDSYEMLIKPIVEMTL